MNSTPGSPGCEARSSLHHARVEAGKLNPIIAETFPFDQIVEAHRRMKSNQQLGKTVVTV